MNSSISEIFDSITILSYFLPFYAVFALRGLFMCPHINSVDYCMAPNQIAETIIEGFHMSIRIKKKPNKKLIANS